MFDLILGIVLLGLAIFMKTPVFDRYASAASNEDGYMTKERMMRSASRNSVILIILGVIFIAIGILRLI